MKTLIFLIALTASTSLFAAETWTCRGSKNGIKSITITGSEETGYTGQLFDAGAFATEDQAIKLEASSNRFENKLFGDDGGGHDVNRYTVNLVFTKNGDEKIIGGKAVVFSTKIVDCVGDFDDVELLKCSIVNK